LYNESGNEIGINVSISWIESDENSDLHFVVQCLNSTNTLDWCSLGFNSDYNFKMYDAVVCYSGSVTLNSLNSSGYPTEVTNTYIRNTSCSQTDTLTTFEFSRFMSVAPNDFTLNLNRNLSTWFLGAFGRGAPFTDTIDQKGGALARIDSKSDIQKPPPQIPSPTPSMVVTKSPTKSPTRPPTFAETTLSPTTVVPSVTNTTAITEPNKKSHPGNLSKSAWVGIGFAILFGVWLCAYTVRFFKKKCFKKDRPLLDDEFSNFYSMKEL
jgi:hypothetical protein